MRLVISCLLLLTFALNPTQSQTVNYLIDERAAPREQFVDFIHLEGSFSFEAKKGLIEGEVKYLFRSKRNKLDSLFLDAPSISIESVKGKIIEYFRSTSAGVWIYFNESLQFDKQHQFEIIYSATPRKGMYFIGWNDPKSLMPKQIWTQGQGIDNRHWLPCFDDQTDKVTTNFSITFDNGFEVISNGALIGKKEKGEKTTWKYEMNQPHSPYLIMIAIGKYQVEERNSKGGTKLKLYYYPDHQDRVEQSYRYSAEMVDWMEDFVGVKYPWVDYKQVPVADFLYGAMENTTATIFGDFFMVDQRGALDREYLEVNMHELAHQWFGDYVTSRSGAHHWLHESFATFFQMRFAQKIKGVDYYRNWMRENAEAAFKQSTKDEMGIGHSMAGSNRHYLKGAYVVDMIAYVIGEEAFKKSLNKFLEDNKFDLVESDDLLYAIHDVTGQDLYWFFDQWVRKGGEPHYKVDFEIDSDNSYKVANFNIQQIHDQSETIGLFKMPINFQIVYKDGSVDSSTYWIENVTQQVNIPLKKGKSVSYVLFDPNSRVLKKVSFEKPFEMLKNQALSARNMIDRLDAVIALRSYPLEQKSNLFKMLISRKDSEFIIEEIAAQVAPNMREEDHAVIIELLAHESPRVSKALLINTPQIPDELYESYAGLLNAKSYEVIELALQALYASRPDKVEELLESTKTVYGIKAKNVRITWLKIAIPERGNQEDIDELVSYTSASFDYLTRVKAAEALSELDYINVTMALNLMDAITNPNGRLRRPCGKILKQFYRKIPYKRIIEIAYFDERWSSREKNDIQKYLR